ncbi:MAG: right-handed parallel beta-helix repeat-containing protein [Verrucomicrobiales bacterium]|nr:right-handed parallel beta-helix repeat-containing protein [Verrucomicrobiales bacterium]
MTTQIKHHVVALMLGVLSYACPALQGQISFVSGEISGSETWSGTIAMVGDVTVKPTGSLTILPGTRIEADWRSDEMAGGTNQNRIELIVQGALSAEGTEGAPIVFTVFPGNPPQTLAAGDWYGLRVASQQVRLRHCVVEYGTVGLSVESGDPLIEHCRFEKNQRGLLVGAGLEVTLSQSEVVGSTGVGIQGSRDGKLTLEGCRLLRNSQGIEWVRDLILTGSGSVISSNTQYGVLVQRKFDLTLTGCEVRGNGLTGCAESRRLVRHGGQPGGLHHRHTGRRVIIGTGT